MTTPRNVPEDFTNTEINRMVEEGAPTLCAETVLGNRPYNLAQHVFDTAAAMNRVTVERRKESTADWLYRRFRSGSAILTKLEAYRIGGELETQAVELSEARATIQRLFAEIADLAVHSPRVGETVSRGPFEPPEVLDVSWPADSDGDDSRDDEVLP